MKEVAAVQPRDASAIFARAAIYAVLILFAVYYLLPLFVMLVNSLKPLSEIREGNMLALPREATLDPWLSAWSSAQIGVQPTGLRPYFLNSILMVVPAVAISTMLGALNGYVLTKWRFKGDTHHLRADALRLLHSVPDRAHPHGAHSRHHRARRDDGRA